MWQVFVLGAYGQRNLGDDALLEVFIDQFCDSRVVVNSARPNETREHYGIIAISTYLGWLRFQLLRAIWHSNLLVFGGGSLLKETEGGPLARLLYLARILLLLLFAKLVGRPTAMLGVGIGPLNHPLYRHLSRLAANLTDLICVRDTASRDLLLSIGVRRPISITADSVFMLAPNSQQPESKDQQTQGDADKLVIVIPRYSLTTLQQAALAAACDYLIETYDVQVLFVPFQTGYCDKFDDLSVTHAIQAQMRCADNSAIWVGETPGETLSMIGRADLIVSTRLHGLIFAAIQGVASVGIDYEVKIQSFMTEIDQTWASISLDGLLGGHLPALLDQAWARREETGRTVRERVCTLHEAAQRNFDLARNIAVRTPSKGLLNGSALLFASMTIVNAGNYLFNLVLGRWLGPSAFADLSLIVTLFLMVTLITSTLQTISAKFAAVYTADNDTLQVARLRRWLGQQAWAFGLILGSVLAFGSLIWQQFFQTASFWPFVILGFGLPFYFAQGVDRGALQGQTRFGGLALTYQAEMWVRLVVAVALVALGWAVNGAVGGLALSLIAAWLVGFWMLARETRDAKQHSASPLSKSARAPFAQQDRRAVFAFAGPVIAALIGQVLINNSDILIVKHFFDPEAAGHYAALALIGRIVFFATASVVAAMFPIVAQKQHKGESHNHLLWQSLGLVLATSGCIIAATLVIPDPLVQLLFGAVYLPIAPLLWLYAVATMLYALANVVINYRLSTGGSGGSTLAVLAGIAQVGGLWLFHNSLREVVLVQVYLMAALFVVLLVWKTRSTTQKTTTKPMPNTSGSRLVSLSSSIARRWRSLLFGTITLCLLLMMWHVVRADAPIVSHPAQQQIAEIMPDLIKSEAEHATGAYIPGVGGVIEIDLLRGPNTIKDKPAYIGTRDWAIYLVQTFGSKLTAVPPDETIAFSVVFYDYTSMVYHQLAITSRAGDVADPSKYKIWLDGKSYDQAVAQFSAEQSASASTPQPTIVPTVEPSATPTQVAPALQPSTSPTTQSPIGVGSMGPTPMAGPINVTLDLANEQARSQSWVAVNGTWSFNDQGYAQTELGKFDLIALLDRPISGDYRFQIDVKFLEGDMGGGIVFNAPTADSKKGAQMISYTAKGSYLQWGYFDNGGVFQYTSGSNVPNGGDGKWHTLAVEVTGKTYSVGLDGTVIAHNLALDSASSGRVGLLASTSHVVFNNFKLESISP